MQKFLYDASERIKVTKAEQENQQQSTPALKIDLNFIIYYTNCNHLRNKYFNL